MEVQEKVQHTAKNQIVTETLNGEKDVFLKYIRRWGNSTSDAILDPRCQIYHHPDIEGIIGYHVAKGCAIVLGDPICALKDIPNLVQAFRLYCQTQGWKIIHIIASEKFAKWAIKNGYSALIEFGEELILDPHCDPRERHGVNGSLVRRKVRHALHEGSKVNEYISQDKHLEQLIEQVGISWLKSRRGPQIYISHVHLFDHRPGKRWFYAQKNEHIVGVLTLNQLKERQGWLLNHLMITPEASHGTPELLVTSTLEKLQQEGCHFVTFGASPKKQLGEILGFGNLTTWLSRQTFRIANKIFRLDGHKKFWEKFHPESERTFLLFDHAHIGIREIWALMRTMNVS